MNPIFQFFGFCARIVNRFYEKMIQSPTIYPTRHYMKHHRFRKGFSY